MFLFSYILDQIVPDDDSTFITMENKTQVETAILAARDHAKMRMRKRKEEESYRIAREAVFSWKTEKEYRKDPVFDDDDDDEENPWWQKPELSKEFVFKKIVL